MGEVVTRTVGSDEDVRAALRCIHTAFLTGKDVTDESVAWCAQRWELDRSWLAVDDGDVCGTARTFPSRVRLPGLDDAPVSCLTNVTVLPTHTRRGALNAMMRAQLSHAVEAGEAASLLIAAEWPIYGRYGYGPACDWVEWHLDTDLARVTGEPFGSLHLVDAAALEKAATTVVARQQAVTPGSIERTPFLHGLRSGTDRPPDDKHEGRARVVHLDEHGEPDAFAVYAPKERWDGMRHHSRLEVEDHAAATSLGERELWRYLAGVDLVTEVRANGSPASVLPYVLADGRAARREGSWDHIWARMLDVPACLTARAYAVADRLVVEVLDPFLGRGGRWALDASPEGATCQPTKEPADLTLPVSALGAGWYGGTDLRLLAAGAWGIDEHAPGAVDRLARLLHWHQTPYCSTDF